jgi:hypothetical protein
MIDLRTSTTLLLVAGAGLIGSACDLDTSRAQRQRSRQVAPVPAAPAPAPLPVATPAAAPAAGAAAAEEEPTAYSETVALQTAVTDEKPAAGADAPASPQPAEVPAAAPAEAFVDSEPPEPVYEERPRAPSAAHLWTPGFWDWGGARWIWRAGMWRMRPTGRVYVPPHYEVVGGRVVYVRPFWGPRLVTRYYGGRVLAVRYPTVRPVWWRPGVRYYVRPYVGHRIGSRPVAIYRTYPRVTSRIVVPPRPVRVVRPAVGVRPGVAVRSAPGMRPVVAVPRAVVAPRPVARPAVRVAPAPRSRRR